MLEQGSDPGPGVKLRFQRPLQHRLALHLPTYGKKIDSGREPMIHMLRRVYPAR